jgi:hypothetical protein
MHLKPQDIPLVAWLLWKAMLAFLMFEFRQAWLALLVAWITVRYQHQVVEVKGEPQDEQL